MSFEIASFGRSKDPKKHQAFQSIIEGLQKEQVQCLIDQLSGTQPYKCRIHQCADPLSDAQLVSKVV